MSQHETAPEPAPHRGEHATPLQRIDTTTAHPARRYNYWLGGKDNFAADRESGDNIAAVFPTVRTAALENRRFLHRTVAYLAGIAGIRQFLDIGVGIPLSPNTHEIAQEVAPDSRIVYVDNDPIVLAHARALLTSHPQGATAYLDADLRDPGSILHHPDLHRTVDLTRPVGLLLVAVLHFLRDDEATHAVAELLGALAPGSYVVLSHGTADFWSADAAAQAPQLQRGNETRYQPRSREEIAGLVAGLHLVDPDPSIPDRAAGTTTPIDRSGEQLMSVSQWRPYHDDHQQLRYVRDEDVACYGMVARTAPKPGSASTVVVPSASPANPATRLGPQP
ncbi:SAM-dependent methyltransferase [Dactylosporangium sp. NPDC005572]|uniref:SAM-dependent methyltransferase n=1 Tax=Dactylosporangium sp. NPDC005572 TaxID=3156889 RepID=UPI0033B6629F